MSDQSDHNDADDVDNSDDGNSSLARLSTPSSTPTQQTVSATAMLFIRGHIRFTVVGAIAIIFLLVIMLANFSKPTDANASANGKPTSTATGKAPAGTAQPPVGIAPTLDPPSGTALPAVAKQAVAAQISCFTIVVQPNDTLYRLSLSYQTTISAIAQTNGISNPNLITVNQKLQICAVSTYKVQAGDNLFRIALRNNTTVADIMGKNGLTSTLIHPGDILKLR